MRYLIISGISAILALNLWLPVKIEKSLDKTIKNQPTKPGSGFAVVELFTSEGCSSCPPADQLFEKVQKEIKNEPVYLLAFHVDYWNRLGWKDPYSSADYSARQNEYASWLNLNTVYTPQAIINGKTEFVGSDERMLRNSIRENLSKTSNYHVRLDEVKLGSHSVSFKYHTEVPLNNISLVYALVQNHSVSRVKSGENEGRTLSHVQIVRNFKTLPLSGKENGSLNLDLMNGIPNQDFELIAFLQKNSNGEILAATKAPISPSNL